MKSILPNLVALWPAISGVLTLAVASWIGHRVTSAKDHERAALLSTIANDAAALAVSKFPASPWSVLFQETVAQISDASGLPTGNADAINRAAAGALKAAGVAAPAK